MKRALLLVIIVVLCSSATRLATAAEPSALIGAWDLTVQTRRGDRPSWVKLFSADGAPVAEFVGATGGKLTAKNVQIQAEQCQWTIGEATYNATLENGTLTGYFSRGERRVMFTGQPIVRRPNLSGIWDVQVNIGDQTMNRELALKHGGEEVTGVYRAGELGDHPLKDVKLDGDHLTYSIDFEFNGQEFVIDYDLEVRGDQYSGTFEVQGNAGEGTVKGARRRNWGETITLFNGRDLSNWEFQENQNGKQWTVVDSVMTNQKAGWNAFSKQKFQDYKLRIDVRVPSRGNSGIYLNGRYEVQVEDGFGKSPSAGSIGAIYGRAIPVANPSRPAGEWQTFEITFVDYWATVTLNGTTIVDNVYIEGITGGALDSHESEPGPLMLQGDHGPIEFRNIELTPIAR